MKHGHARRGRIGRTYRIWRHIIRRCNDANAPFFKDYGGRGIRVCDRWLDFANFLADVGEIHAPLTIDRIDNNRGYEPGNVRQATRLEQSRNRRNLILVDADDGRRVCLAEASAIAGIGYGTVYGRVQRGWSISKALSTPVDTKKRHTGRGRSAS